MAKIVKNKQKTQKNRKELRKIQRKEKKQRKFQHYVQRSKPGKFVTNPQNNKNDNNDVYEKDSKHQNKKKPIPKEKTLNHIDNKNKEIKKERDAHKKLQREMKNQRKKQLQAANVDEDRNIKQLEKCLKLNKRKSKSVPKSFTTDGLDYLLELCDPENMKNIVEAEKQFVDFNDDFEDDFALMTEKKNKNKITSKKDDDLSDNNSISDLSNQDSEEMLNDDLNSNSDVSMDSEIDDEDSFDENDDIEIKDNNKRKKHNDNIKSNKKRKETKDSETEEAESDLDNESNDVESDKSDENDDSYVKEDIYGRKIGKDNSIIVENSEGKYVPPALRANKEGAEKLARLRRQLKGLLNRLAESNMHNISTQIEEMYMSNSRNNMNETLTTLIFEAVISFVTTPERLLLEYVSLITILHANVGTEVGAYFLQTVVKKFDELYNKDQPVENKELDNTVHILAQLYNFKIVSCQLLNEILRKLGEKFEEKHVECILLVLKNVGFSLRKDDPLALKQLIIDLQKKATTVVDNNARVKYMLDILLAIKNNNVSKIPNYDTSYSEHLKKILKGFIRKGKYVSQLNITLDDLLKADERGRWWIVGSAWTGKEEVKDTKNTENNTSVTKYNQKLLELARKQRMNTDTRRSIFCALMTAENYIEAFEKILSVGLKGQQEREIIHVLLHCSLQEKEYNPYYTFLAQKFCEYDRKYQMMIRCSIWDKLKALSECSGKQISILAKLLTYLFLNQGLPISTLKVIQFTELDQVTLRLMRQVLLGILLHSNEEEILAVFEKITSNAKMKMFKDSLKLFIHHFLLRKLNESKFSDEHKNLLAFRVKLIDKCLSTTDKVKY